MGYHIWSQLPWLIGFVDATADTKMGLAKAAGKCLPPDESHRTNRLRDDTKDLSSTSVSVLLQPLTRQQPTSLLKV